MKEFLNSKKASKTAAILFAVFGGLVAVVGILVGRLTAVAPDEISADARSTSACFYSLLCDLCRCGGSLCISAAEDGGRHEAGCIL